MTTFSPKTPDSGWERRWPREALTLMKSSPDIILVFLLIALAAGGVKSFVSVMGVGFGPQILVEVFLVCTVFSPLICWAQFAIGRREGYVQGRFGGYGEGVRISLNTALFVLAITMAFFLTLWGRSLPPPDDLTLRMVVSSSASGLGQGVIFSWAGVFRTLTVGLVNAGMVENRIIAQKAHNKLTTVFPRVTVCLILVFYTSFLISQLLALVLFVVMLFITYVAGREIIGGITGNKHESESWASDLART